MKKKPYELYTTGTCYDNGNLRILTDCPFCEGTIQWHPDIIAKAHNKVCEPSYNLTCCGRAIGNFIHLDSGFKGQKEIQTTKPF